MNQFPTLTTGVVTMTPATLGTGFATRVLRFCNDAEQRWATRGDFAILTCTGLPRQQARPMQISRTLSVRPSRQNIIETNWV